MLGSVRGVLLAKKSGVVIPSGLVAAYSFSEGSGTTIADVSGNGHVLTLNNASWTAGHTGTGVTNTGTGQGAGAVFLGPSAAITMMAWVQPLDLPAGGTRVAMGIFKNGSDTDVAIFTERSDFGTPDLLQCNLRIGGSLRSVYGPALTIGNWVHIAITFDGSTVRLYVNGSQYSTGSFSGTVGMGDRLTVAGNSPGNAYDSDVVVDDVRIFSVALDATQVASMMTTPVS